MFSVRLSPQAERYYWYRVGDYGVVYAIDDAAQTAIVALTAHRCDVYE